LFSAINSPTVSVGIIKVNDWKQADAATHYGVRQPPRQETVASQQQKNTLVSQTDVAQPLILYE
jgi:hypothetical protein